MVSYWRYKKYYGIIMNMRKYRKQISIMLLFFLTLLLISCKSAGKEQTEPEEISDAGSETVEIEAVKIETNRIAVIDTGFSTKAIPEEHIVEGRNYLNPDASTEDTFGHGTAVASIILQRDPDAELVPLVDSAYEDGKITQVETDVLAQIIRDAVDVYGCQVINLSAGLQKDETDVQSAVQYAQKCGALIVASAGNDYLEQGEMKYYPAAYERVFAVGALNADGTAVADFSQRGDWVNGYEIGEQVSFLALSGAAKEGDGTSYAAAKVSAQAAVLWKEHPEYTVEQVFQTLGDRLKAPD